MAIFISIRWQEAISACSIWFSRSVSPASFTFLIWFTLVRVHSGKNWFGDSRKIVALFLVFPHLGNLADSWSIRFYTHLALSGCLFGWLRNFHGLVSAFQVLVSNQDILGNSSSTPSWFLIFTGGTRYFPVLLLVHPSFGSLLLKC